MDNRLRRYAQDARSALTAFFTRPAPHTAVTGSRSLGPRAAAPPSAPPSAPGAVRRAALSPLAPDSPGPQARSPLPPSALDEVSAAEPPHGSAAGAAVVAPGLEVAEPGVDEGDVPRLYVTAGGAAMVGTVEAAGGQLEYPLREQVVTMGTSEQADLRLAGEDPAVEYAELRRTPDGEQYEIRSLRTPTVVLVNGQPVAEARLEDGYRIEVGGVALVYRSHSHPRGDVGRQGGEGSGHPNEI